MSGPELGTQHARPIEDGLERLEHAIQRLDKEVNGRLSERIEVALGPVGDNVVDAAIAPSPDCSPLLRQIWHMTESLHRIAGDLSAMTDRIEL